MAGEALTKEVVDMFLEIRYVVRADIVVSNELNDVILVKGSASIHGQEAEREHPLTRQA